MKPHDHKNQNDFALGHTKEIDPQVLLIDAGCEWNNYASDITRTIPVGNGGKFTPEARAIYELVLEMQAVCLYIFIFFLSERTNGCVLQKSFSIIEPGLHWDAVQLLCHRILIRGFQKLGIFKSPNSPDSGSWNSEEAILQSGISSAFFPHGVGHSMGMDVHDVPSASKPAVNPTIKPPSHLNGHESFYTYLRLRLPLEVGMVVVRSDPVQSLT